MKSFLKKRMIQETDDNLDYLINYSFDIDFTLFKDYKEYDKQIDFLYTLVMRDYTTNSNEIWQEYSDELESFELCIKQIFIEKNFLNSFELLFMQIKSFEISELKKVFLIIKEEYSKYIQNKKLFILIISNLHLLFKKSKEKKSLFILNGEFEEIKLIRRYYHSINNGLYDIGENFNKLKQELDKFIINWKKMKENEEFNELCCFNDHRSIFFEKKQILTEFIKKSIIELECYYHNICDKNVNNTTECEFILNHILELLFSILKIEDLKDFILDLENTKFCEIDEKEIKVLKNKVGYFEELTSKLPKKEYLFKLALLNHKEDEEILNWLDKKAEEFIASSDKLENEVIKRLSPFIFGDTKPLFYETNKNENDEENKKCDCLTSGWIFIIYQKHTNFSSLGNISKGLIKNYTRLMTDLGNNLHNEAKIYKFKRKKEEIDEKYNSCFK